MNSRVVKKKVRIDLYEGFLLKTDLRAQLTLEDMKGALLQEFKENIPENMELLVEEKMYRPTGQEMIFEITVGWEEKDNRSEKANSWRKRR